MIAIAAASACSEPKYVPRPLPALVAPVPAAQVQEIKPAALGFTPGDRLVLDVRARGFSIGRVELTVGDGEIRSHFATGTLASAFASVGHDLVTVLDQHRAKSSTEQIEMDGIRRQFATNFAGTTSHTVHTALGAIRAWATREAAPGFLHVVFADKLVRVDLAQPAVVQGGMRVDGKIAGLDAPVSLSIYFSDERHILRIEARSEGEQITATPSF